MSEPCNAVAEALAELKDALSDDLVGSRHDTMVAGQMRLIGLGANGHPGVESALDELKATFIDAMASPLGGGRVLAPGDARAEWSQALAGAVSRAMVDHPSPAQDDPCERPSPLAAVNVGEGEYPRLPDDWWDARPLHRHVRQAALNRQRNPDAVMGAAMARLAATSNHTITLPIIVGSPCGLSCIVALLGKPGSGKSNAASIIRDLIARGPHLDPEADMVPPGTKEGLVDLLLRDIKEKDSVTGRVVKVRQQAIFNVYVNVDEGSAVLHSGKLEKSVPYLTPLRTIFTEGTLGQTNTEANRRRIEAGQYTFGIVMGLQPALAADLFGEAGLGTPQRFFWHWASKPGREILDNRPDWPGQFTLPRLDVSKDDWKMIGGFNRLLMTANARIERRIREIDIEEKPELEEHKPLLLLKAAGLMALEVGSLEIGDEDWQLAEVYNDISRASMYRLLAESRQLRDRSNQASTAAYARRQIDTQLGMMDAVVERHLPNIVRKVTVKFGGEVQKYQLERQLSAPQRDALSEVLDLAESRGLLTVTEEPGKNSQDEPVIVIRTGPQARGKAA